MKKLMMVAIAVALALLAFTGQALSQEVQLPQTEWQPGKDAEPVSLVFALSVKKTPKDDQEKTQYESAQFLAKALMAGYTGTPATATVLSYADAVEQQHPDMPLRTIDNFHAACGILDDLDTSPIQNGYEQSFHQLCKYLNETYRTPPEGEEGKRILWVIGRQDPAILTQDSLPAIDGPDDVASPKASAFQQLYALLEANPQMELHILYFHEKPDGGERSILADEYLRQNLTDPDRFYVDYVDTENEEQAREDIIAIVRENTGAYVETDTLIWDEANANETTYEYSYHAVSNTEACLLLVEDTAGTIEIVSADVSAEAAAAEESETQDSVAAGALSGSESPTVIWDATEGFVWFWLQPMPAGSYTLHLTFREPSAQAPVIKAYRILPDRFVWMEQRTENGSQALGETPWFRGRQSIDLYTDAVEVPPEQWNLDLYWNNEPFTGLQPCARRGDRRAIPLAN